MNIRHFSKLPFRLLARVEAAALLLCLALPLLSLAQEGFAAPLRVALLLESEKGAMAQMLQSGLAKAAQECGAQASVVVAPPSDEGQTAAFRKAAKENDLVIVAEARLHEVLRNNAANFRRVKFGCIDTGVRAVNIMSVTYKDEDPCCLAGAASAMIAGKGGRLGWVMDDKSPIQDHMLAAFKRGVELSGQEIEVVVKETGFNNPAGAGEAVSELAAQGARCVVLAAGPGSLGGYAAASASGPYIVSLDSPQAELAPQKVVMGIVKRHDLAVQEIVRSAASASFRAKEIVVYTMQNDGAEFFLSPALKGSLPSGLERRVRELSHELAVGNIELEDLRNPTYCNCQ